MIIKIDVPDWLDEYNKTEPDLSSFDEFVQRSVEDGLTTAEISRRYIVARELQHAPDDVLPANKTLLQNGGSAFVNVMFARVKATIEAKGREYRARALVGPVSEKEAEQESGKSALASDANMVIGDADTFTGFAEIGSELALQRATKYLDSRVPGYIWGRLLDIHAADGDVAEAADKLHQKIDEMVERLV